MKKYFNETGIIKTIPLLAIIATVGIISFLLISSTAPFSSGIFQKLNPKSASQAAYVNNLNLPTNLPLCSTVGVIHDRTKWHSLVHFQNSDDPADPNRGNPICHYDHTHGMNPNDPAIVNVSVNTPTGTVKIGSAGVLANGQTISYPWQTFKGAGENYPSPPPNFADMENGFKHNFYNWVNRINMPCITLQSDNDGCITDFRWQEHGDTSYIGAQARFHSFSVEAKVCKIANQSDCGIIRLGGWINYGFLFAPNTNKIPIPAVDPSDPNDQQKRLHQPVIGGAGPLSLCQPGQVYPPTGEVCGRNMDVTWYGNTQGFFQDGYNAEGYGPVNPTNPTQKLLYSDFGHPEIHGSWAKAEILAFGFNPWDDIDGKNDGHINYKGYEDRYGKLITNSSCTQAGLDCVPIELINVPVAHYLYRESLNNPNLTNDQINTDITPVGIPSWVVYNDTYVPDQTPNPSMTSIPSSTPRPSVTPAPTPNGSFETYSANLTPVAGTGSSGSGKYTFKLMCNPEPSGSFAGQYMVIPSTTVPDTFVTNLLGNPYNAHIHYTSSGARMRTIIVANDPPPPNIPPVSWLSQLLIPDTNALAPALTQSERNEVRFQQTTGRPGTWVNIHTNACASCQNGELQGDLLKISGSCSQTTSPAPTPTLPTPTPNTCPRLPLGDANCDGAIDIFDYSLIITHFNQSGTNILGDVNKDGIVDIFDYSLIITHFGQ